MFLSSVTRSGFVIGRPKGLRLRKIVEQVIGRPEVYACVMKWSKNPRVRIRAKKKRNSMFLSSVTRSGFEPETPTLKVLCSTS